MEKTLIERAQEQIENLNSAAADARRSELMEIHDILSPGEMENIANILTLLVEKIENTTHCPGCDGDHL